LIPRPVVYPCPVARARPHPPPNTIPCRSCSWLAATAVEWVGGLHFMQGMDRRHVSSFSSVQFSSVQHYSSKDMTCSFALPCFALLLLYATKPDEPSGWSHARSDLRCKEYTCALTCDSGADGRMQCDAVRCGAMRRRQRCSLAVNIICTYKPPNCSY
jgi:hypothetical protein